MNETPDLTALHIASGDLWAGAETQLFYLARALDNRKDISVIVVLLNHGILEQKLCAAGIQTIVLDENVLSSLRIIRHLVRILREFSPDVVHTHRFKENILGSIAALIAGRIPSLRTIHGGYEYIPYQQSINQRIIGYIDILSGRFLQKRIIAVSEDLADILGKRFPADKISIISNGIDIDDVRRQANSGSKNNRDEPDTFRIGLAGRLVPVKRVDLFIETARHTLDQCPDIKPGFHIFGDGPLLEELKDLSTKLETTKVVHFEGHCDNIILRLQGMDALLMTSDHEGMPMILLEAMALEIPVIAHEAGGIPALLDQGCGVLVNSHIASAYAREVCNLAKSSHTRSDISRNALARVTSRYSADICAENYLSEYKIIRDGT